MKILWLYRYTQHRHYNHWFHSDFARVISEQENVILKMYGYKLEDKKDFKDLLLCEYNSHKLMVDLKKEFDYDIIILDCWNRAYTDVNIKKLWIPNDFASINVPKIVIEGDYHNIKNPKWYMDFNFNAIFHRHKTNVERANKDIPIKNIWLPISIDTNIFKPNPNIVRTNKICAVGEFDAKVYEYRKRVYKILNQQNLIERKSLLREEKYIICLQSYISHLSCSSIYDLNIAKMFEIMASGSVLLTDECKNSGIAELFPENSYCTYQRDCTNLINKAQKIINEPSYRKFIIANAIECINKRHTHKIRAKQFIEQITKIFNL